MHDGFILIITVFVAVSSLVMLLSLLAPRRQNSVASRVDHLAGSRTGRPASGAMRPHPGGGPAGLLSSLLPRTEEKKNQLGDRVIQAGFYRKNFVVLYVGVKTMLMISPLLLAVVASGAGLMSLTHALLFGLITGIAGTIAPSFWLDYQKRKRQTSLRRALPDAVDVIVICVEAGLSLPAALARVSRELNTAHPMLASEIAIVQREIQMGYSTGEALKRLANRFDVEEVRSLASVIEQSERYGASIVKALRVHGDTLRLKRHQSAEEKARKAAVKILFPTILFIFPALFVVLLGPAVHDLLEMILGIARDMRAH